SSDKGLSFDCVSMNQTGRGVKPDRDAAGLPPAFLDVLSGFPDNLAQIVAIICIQLRIGQGVGTTTGRSMRAVLQRVGQARVTAEGETVGEITHGLLVLLGVTHDDTVEKARWLADKTAGLRVFADGEGKMNRSVVDVGGSVLVVSQFTL